MEYPFLAVYCNNSSNTDTNWGKIILQMKLQKMVRDRDNALISTQETRLRDKSYFVNILLFFCRQKFFRCLFTCENFTC